jgi:hypothetical protein
MGFRRLLLSVERRSREKKKECPRKTFMSHSGNELRVEL